MTAPFLPEEPYAPGLSVIEVDFARSATQGAPFQATRIVVDPGAHSPVDKHAVTECWLASTGTARMTLGDEELTLTPGDIIAIAPHVPHQVFNESDDDFVFFSVWWDANKEQAVEAGEG